MIEGIGGNPCRPPGPVAGRLRIIDADQLSFALKTPWSDGTTHLLLSPLELLEKLAALEPPPPLNLIRYHGILAGVRHSALPAPASCWYQFSFELQQGLHGGRSTLHLFEHAGKILDGDLTRYHALKRIPAAGDQLDRVIEILVAVASDRLQA